MDSTEKALLATAVASVVGTAFYVPLIVQDLGVYGFAGSWRNVLAIVVLSADVVSALLAGVSLCARNQCLAAVLIVYVAFALGLVAVFASTVPVSMLACCCEASACLVREEYMDGFFCEDRREDIACEDDRWRVALFWAGIPLCSIAHACRLVAACAFWNSISQEATRIREYLDRRARVMEASPHYRAKQLREFLERRSETPPLDRESETPPADRRSETPPRALKAALALAARGQGLAHPAQGDAQEEGLDWDAADDEDSGSDGGSSGVLDDLGRSTT